MRLRTFKQLIVLLTAIAATLPSGGNPASSGGPEQIRAYDPGLAEGIPTPQPRSQLP